MADAPPGLAQTCSEYLEVHTTQLEAAVDAGQRGTAVAQRYAQVFDGLLGSLYCGADAEARAEDGGPGRVALVAVGGYGRRTVAPHSDVDVLFLCDDPSDPRVAALAERLLYPLWDAGVDIGHAVRGLGETLELSETDIRTSTTLLDARHVAGDRALVEALLSQGRQRIFRHCLDGFLASLRGDTQSRHERFGGSIYLREPELKLGRGGLRDLDVVIWSARALWDVDELEALVERKMLTGHELDDLLAAREHLWSVRNHLHVSAGRRHDRLTFDDQEGIADRLGYRDGMTLAVEQFMQDHYRHRRAVARLVDCIGDRVRRARRPPPTTIRDLGDGIVIHDDRVTFKVVDLHRRPAQALELYRHVVREHKPPDPEARDAITAAAADRDWCRDLRRDSGAAPRFLRLLTRIEPAPVRRGSLVDELHELGLLVAMVPELEPILGRVRHDAYHTYTIDAQTVMAIDRLRELARGELASEYVVVSRSAAEVSRPVPLFLALLLHGIGHGHPDDPARHGAAIAAPIAERLGLDAADVGDVQWLIANQGKFYHWALRRDITDPDTIAEVVREVRDVHRLQDLYLMTFCLVATVNPTAMTAWNARMLEDLWTVASAEIEGKGAISEQANAVREQALRESTGGEQREAVEALLAEVSDRYLLANTADGVRFHAGVLAQARGPARLAFGATQSGVGEGTLELVVATEDRPGLLSDITAALAACRFSVDAAQLYTRREQGGSPQAFDLFHVSHPNMAEPGLMQDELDRLRQHLEQLLGGEVTADELLGRRSKRPGWEREGPKVKTEVHVDNSASNRFTIVDVYTRDRPDLLHAIARTLHERGLSIAFAKVNTEGTNVADVFYVRTGSGEKLSGEGQLAQLSGVLRKTIRDLD